MSNEALPSRDDGVVVLHYDNVIALSLRKSLEKIGVPNVSSTADPRKALELLAQRADTIIMPEATMHQLTLAKLAEEIQILRERDRIQIRVLFFSTEGRQSVENQIGDTLGSVDGVFGQDAFLLDKFIEAFRATRGMPTSAPTHGEDAFKSERAAA
jgi:hypothetical protein